MNTPQELLDGVWKYTELFKSFILRLLNFCELSRKDPIALGNFFELFVTVLNFHNYGDGDRNQKKNVYMENMNWLFRELYILFFAN